MQPLRVLDAAFLNFEQPTMPMNIGAALVFEGPVPERRELRSFVASVVARYPRYRERVQTTPHSLGHLAWQDDPTFTIDRHVRWTALPTPHDEAELANLAGRIMSERLDRDRPLWEIWAVQGLEHCRWALIIKIHHAMLDGVAGAQLLTSLLDHTREPGAADESAPRWPAFIGEEAKGANTTSVAQSLRDTWVHTARTASDGLQLAQGLRQLVQGLATGPSVSIHGSISAYRAFSVVHVRLADVERVRSALGGTVNDVVLAILSGAFRELLVQRGDDPDREPIRSLVPVSTRRPGSGGRLDNRISAVLCELPTHILGPLERLRWVSARMTKLKHAQTIEGVSGLLRASELVPPVVLAKLTQLAAKLLRKLPLPSPTTLTTHVRGPRSPVYCLGRKLLHCYPYVPIAHGMRVGVAVLTYDDHVEFGVSSDYASVPESNVVAASIPAQLHALLELAEHAARTTLPAPGSTTAAGRKPHDERAPTTRYA